MPALHTDSRAPLQAGPAGTGRNSVLISIEVLKGMKCGLAETR